MVHAVLLPGAINRTGPARDHRDRLGFVITEAGTVYLLGLVTQRESDAAVEIARTTAGVMKVVRMMEIIAEEQARQIDNRPPEPAKKPAPAAQ